VPFDGRLLSGIGVLKAVIEAGSFARAADALGLTQPAVSRAVARLEDRVGIRVFNRTARAISLTDEGRRFYEMVEPLIAGIEEATALAGTTKAVVRGRLRVNVDATFGHYVLAPRINEMLDRYPELSIELYARDTIGDFVGDGMDVAVRFGEPDGHGLAAELLLQTRVLTCASHDYVRRHGTPFSPADLADHQCILIRDPMTGRPFAWEFQRGGETVPFAAQGRITVNDTGSLVGACRSGAGIAQLLEVYATDLLDDDIVRILPNWSDETFPLYAYYRRSDLMPGKTRAFIEFVRDVVVGAQARWKND
jgi:DNA-binding transcriptional LysR family regulator